MSKERYKEECSAKYLIPMFLDTSFGSIWEGLRRISNEPSEVFTDDFYSSSSPSG